jgi:hypothetical protein
LKGKIMRHVSHVSMLSIRNVFLATTLLGSMALAVSAAPPGNPPANNPDLGGPPVGAGASDSEKGFDGGKQGGKKGGGRMGDERGKGMVWMKTFEQIKPTLSADVQTKAEAIKTQFETSMQAWKATNGDKMKALSEQMKAAQGQKPDPAVMDQMKALRETMPKMEDSQKQIFALMSESEQAAFKTKLDANEKQMKSKRGADEMGADEKGDGKGKGKGKGKGNAGGKPGDGAPPPGGDSDKAPPPPPFDP